MRRAGVAAVVAALAVGLGACGGGGRASAPCDDRVRASSSVPAATAARMGAHGITEVVGEGDVWFVAPAAARWSVLVEDRRAKVALWVDRAGSLPPVAVRRLGGGGAGEVASDPTAAGLPGPVPTTVTFPGAGCWEVVATGRTGVARLVVEVD